MNESREQLLEILDVLSYLQKDIMIPKNVRSKIRNAHSALLEEDKNLYLRVDKSIQELDDIAEDPNIPIDTKTQLWNIFSKLEGIQQ
tara:strand:- start:1629 stop:1889 length:261 start_codon:yes stop_codon:yes gene_type:complete